MLKAETEWKLPLEKLGMLAEVLKECDAGGGNGQSYEDYLSGLLILGKKQQRNLRVLDLIECNRRMEKGGETFGWMHLWHRQRQVQTLNWLLFF